MTAGSYAHGHKFGAMLAGLYQDSLHQCSACSDFAQDPPCSYTSGTRPPPLHSSRWSPSAPRECRLGSLGKPTRPGPCSHALRRARCCRQSAEATAFMIQCLGFWVKGQRAGGLDGGTAPWQVASLLSTPNHEETSALAQRSSVGLTHRQSDQSLPERPAPQARTQPSARRAAKAERVATRSTTCHKRSCTCWLPPLVQVPPGAHENGRSQHSATKYLHRNSHDGL